MPLVTHAPISLLPTPFPRSAYLFAKRLQVSVFAFNLTFGFVNACLHQPLFNLLVHRISIHPTFLDEVCQSVAEVDTFTAALYAVYQQTRTPVQPIVLGIHRSDYLLHQQQPGAEPVPQQVELNTIASSFSSLSYLTSQLHRHLLSSSTSTSSLLPQLAETASDRSLADAIAEAWRLYSAAAHGAVPGAVVVMIVQPGEKNAFDQRWIEYQLAKLHGIKLLRKTLLEMATGARVGLDHTLYLTDGQQNDIGVAVVYYRAGYTPVDYPSDKEWAARLLIEQSSAIKCPSIAYHLAGLKKVQQVLALPGQVEKFMSPEESAQLRASFTGLFPLSDDAAGLAAVELALANPAAYVLKPQREGGGNNFYNEQVKEMLLKLTPKERSAYILMERILPPSNPGKVLRKGVLSEYPTVSELGIYGCFIGYDEK